MWTGCVATPKSPAAGGTLESLRSTRNASAVSGRTCVPSEQRGVSGGLYSPGAALKRNRPGETPRRALAPPSLVGAELGLTGLVGLTVGGSRLKGELVQIAAPWPVDSSRPRLGSWSNISDHQPVTASVGDSAAALPPSSGGSPPLKVALVRAAQRAPVAHEKRQGLGQGAGARTGLVPPAPSPPAQLSRARHGRPRGSPRQGAQQRP